MLTAQSLAGLAGAPIATLRRRVRDTLEANAGFRQLAPAEQRKLAFDMVKVLAYMTDPRAGQPEPTLARGLAEKTDNTIADSEETKALKSRVAAGQQPAGKDISGAAARSASDTMSKLVKDVDFPGFVRGLIDGVFTSIVDSSIKQMQEFAKFLEAVAKSVDQFANEHVAPAEAREHLASRFPDALKVDGSGDDARLALRDDVDDEKMPDFQSLFGLGQQPDVNDEESEAQLVRAAQLEMAKMRQQQLSTMVLLGLNRIVVTSGEIKATVSFDVSSHESVKRGDSATMNDTNTASNSSFNSDWSRQRNFWGTPTSGSYNQASTMNTRVSTVQADSKNDSEATLDAKARLTGFVQVKFKSETFPLERMASQVEMASLQEKSKR